MSSGSRSGEFCPRCGDEISRPSDIDLPSGPSDPDAVLCDGCYFEDFDLVDAPERIEVRVCSQCGALHRGNRWVDVGARDYTDIAVEETADRLAVHVDAREVDWGVEPEQVDQNTIRMHCLFSGVIRGTAVSEEVTVPVYVARETCDRCGRIAGDYYASIIQVRGTDRTPTTDENDRAVEIAESYIAEREATGDRNAFITETSRTDDGVDMKISTNQMGQGIAKRIVAELGGTVSEAPTLVTEDGDGNEVYRVTFTARLPPYTPGDVIDLDDGDGPVLVTSAHGNLKGVRLATGDRYEADFEEGIDPDARTLGTREDAESTTLVAVEDAHAVQVLDPETFESKTVPRPSYLDPDADEVPVLKHRQGLHVLPDDEL
ncbi:NMD3 family protein [Natronomonas pharaonis DSM 2160]|uniref:NMD3 family protein n=1 Tax=Natronomonas pharaonis (strain ATCC 35678 / DSM 2160 / CIP 103997 / JCM 8858 / NBRC 14720 / NCIMB 2260 / Gabara) TaxID=348780 RepID=A0A1U7EUU5_NATPD|nr:60S ribosomal export protein NMD3 [Natronomonas pharaonis]CAI48770.1 NMD3 family protein [Natronomonas pharaonis DSM 2160]